MINPIPTGRTAPVKPNSGILNAWVQQPTSDAPVESSSGVPTYSEQFKGPYAEGKDILSKVRAGYTMAEAHAGMRQLLSNGILSAYAAPACPKVGNLDSDWIVDSIGVRELEPGDHCLLDIKYKASNSLYDVQNLKVNEEKDVWSLTWQSYTVCPYAFCSNEEHIDTIVSPGANGAEYEPNWELSAQRSHIDSFRNLVENKFHGANGAYIYTQGQQRYYLNPTEVAVLKKVELGKQPVYHYPVLTHQTESSGRWTGGGSVLSYSSAVGQDIDHIVNANQLSGCPLDFSKGQQELKAWQWIKVADEVTQTKSKKEHTVSYTRKEVFWGFKDIDINFYGNTAFEHSKQGILSSRWELGTL